MVRLESEQLPREDASRLASRPPRLRDYAAESRAFAGIAQALTGDSNVALQTIVANARALCGAGTVGIAWRLPDADDASIHWKVISGAWETGAGRAALANLALDDLGWGSPLACLSLASYEESPAPRDRPPLVESLSVPIEIDSQQSGRLWLAAHHADQRFHPEDTQIALAFAHFAAVALGKQRTLAPYSSGVAMPPESSSRRLTSRAAPPASLSPPLAQGDAYYRKVLGDGPPGMALLGLDMRFLAANPVFCRLVGYTLDELRQLLLADLLHAGDRAEGVQSAERVFGGELSACQMEKRWLHRSGKIVWINFTFTLIRDDQGVARYGLGFAADATARRSRDEKLQQAHRELKRRVEHRTRMLEASHHALRESELRFRAVFDQAFQFLGLLHPQGQVILINQTALQFGGTTLDEVEGQPLWSTPWWTDAPAAQQKLQAAVATAAGGGVVRDEIVVRGSGEEVAILDFSLKPLRDDDAGVRMLIMEGRDITEQKKLQKAILEIPLREQRRIGQDLHDGTGQELTGLAYLAQSLLDLLEAKSLPEAALAARISEGLRESLKQVRVLAKGLVPVDVDSEGLMVALSDLALNTGATYDLACGFRCDQPVPILDNATATQLYRIAQEAVTNAVKHSRCRAIQITLQADDDWITLAICDDGVGLPVTDTPPNGLGLRIMSYRAGMVGASLAFHPAVGGGMCVRCTISNHRS